MALYKGLINHFHPVVQGSNPWRIHWLIQTCSQTKRCFYFAKQNLLTQPILFHYFVVVFLFVATERGIQGKYLDWFFFFFFRENIFVSCDGQRRHESTLKANTMIKNLTKNVTWIISAVMSTFIWFQLFSKLLDKG